MSMMADAATSFDVHILRRAQSTGNLPDSQHPPRLDRSSGSHRHSEARTETDPVSADTVQHRTSRMASPNIAIPQLAHLPSTDSEEQMVIDIAQPEIRVQEENPNREPPPLVERLLRLIGYSGVDAKARRELLSLIWNLGIGIAQFIVTVVLLVYSAHHESPTKPGLTEWQACSKPLGVWDSLWLIRVVLAFVMTIWGWRRDRSVRLAQEQLARDRDPESPFAVRGLNRNGAASPATLRNYHGPARIDYDEYGRTRPIVPARSVLYSRLSVLSTFISLAWFLTAHILEYTSVNDCRYTSPHLWWLTFGLLCILYVMVLEIFLLGLLVFVFGPVIYLLWNIILLCLGRHPLQNPHYINPEIGKLPKSVVDQIPLVLYIPPPPEDYAEDSGKGSKKSPVTIPSPVYSYPPKRPAQQQRRRRFAFLRRHKDKSKGDGDNSARSGADKKPVGEPEAWEDRWEQGEYPFVRLEGNRAVCAICLLDFEEPKRLCDDEKKEKEEQIQEPDHNDKAGGVKQDTVLPTLSAEHAPIRTPAGSGEQGVQEIRVEEVTEEERTRLRLDDAGEGAQPLRLLECGHVFHKTCVDPWLTDVSGRCPVCQRPVLPQRSPKRGRRGTMPADGAPQP